MYFLTFREEDNHNSQLQMDEEELDVPLPLRSDNEWQHYSPVLPPPHYIPNCGKEKWRTLWSIKLAIHR